MKYLLAFLLTFFSATGALLAQVAPTPPPPQLTGDGSLVTTIANGAAQAQALPTFFGRQLHNTDFNNTTGASIGTNGLCNGLSDVTSAIQDEVNAGAGVAEVYIDAGVGNCIYSSDIIVPSYSHIHILGYMLQAPSVNTNAFHFAGNSHDSFVDGEGVGTIDGNGANESSSASFNQGVISQSTTNRLRVRDLYITNTRNSAINLAHCSFCYMANDVVYYTTPSIGHAVEFSASSNNCWADNMNISGIGLDGGWAFYGGVTYCGISNSISSSNAVNGFGADDDNALPTQSAFLIYANDIAFLNLQYGFGVGAVSPGVAEANITYLADICTQNNYGCFWFRAGSHITVNGGLAYKDSGPTAYCIYEAGDEQPVTYIQVVGFHCTDEGTGGTIGQGINVAGPTNASHTMLADNLIVDDGAGVMQYGITGDLGAGSSDTDNQITGMLAAADNATTHSDTAFWEFNGTKWVSANGITVNSGGLTVTAGNIVASAGNISTTVGNISAAGGFRGIAQGGTAETNTSFVPIGYTQSGGGTGAGEKIIHYSCAFSASTSCAVTFTGTGNSFTATNTMFCPPPDMAGATTYVGFTVGNKTTTSMTVYASASNSDTVYGFCEGY